MDAKRSQPPKPQIVLATTDDALRQAFSDLLIAEGFQVQTARDVHSIVERARDSHAIGILIDLPVSHSDLVAWLRVLRKNPQTSGAGLIVAVPQSLGESARHEITEASQGVLLSRPLQGPQVVAKFRAFAARHADAAGSHVRGSATGQSGNPALLMRRVECQFHKDQKPFHYYMLRAGKVASEMSFLELPVYGQAIGGGPVLDYSFLSVLVCPVCGFASSQPEFFLHPGCPRVSPHAFSPSTIGLINEARTERQALVAHAAPTLYGERRTRADAVLAYELAIMSARVLIKSHPHAYAAEQARIGNYHLRLAMMHDDGAAPAAAEEHYRRAYEVLRAAYTYLTGATFFRNAYQIIALGIYLGDDTAASQFLSRLRELELAARGRADNGPLIRYLALAQRAWEDREYHRRAVLATA